ncbi:MAG: hypothetical protein WCJ07_08640, partial [Verrucomicrobiota bacterium]
RKRLPLLALVLGLVAVGWFVWRQISAPVAIAVPDKSAMFSNNQSGSTTSAAPAKLNAPGQPAYASPAATATSSVNSPANAGASARTALPFAVGVPQEPEFTNFPPVLVLEKVAHVIRDYASMFGGNPVGTNPEITAALQGSNPRQSNFINAEDGLRLNAGSELVDAWGTPYFFHQLSGREMEIRSAGPDRILWTPDDLIAR